jgi:ribonuclease-3
MDRQHSPLPSPLSRCEDLIGYQFQDRELLQSALTHSSGANNRKLSNERLEFLGDSVLGLVVCEELYARFPDYQEGDLTKMKSVMVSRKTCARICQRMQLDQFLILGKSLNIQDTPANIQANVFEALVAAIFLDGGWGSARAFVLRCIQPELVTAAEEATFSSAKSLLQTYSQKIFGTIPRYVILDEQGPDHDKCFKITAELNGRQFEPVWGRNKKEAEMRAALNALAELQGNPIPYPLTPIL